MPVDALRVAVAERADGRAEAIAGRAGAVVGEAQDLAVERGEILRQRWRRDVAEGHVERADRARTSRASRCGCWPPAHRRAGPTPSAEPVVHLAEAHQPRDRAAGAVGGVGQVDEVVRREVRVHGKPEDAAFVAREDVGEGERGLGQQRAVLIDAHAARALADSRRPSGVNARLQGICRPVTSVCTPKRVPSAAVNVVIGSPPGGLPPPPAAVSRVRRRARRSSAAEQHAQQQDRK